MTRLPDLAPARLLGSVVLVGVLVGVLVVAVRLTDAGEAVASPAGGPAARVRVPDWPEPASLRAVRVLEQWQSDREAAWGDGDLTALRALYVPGARAGRRDAALLGSYAVRGLRLELHTRSDRLAVLTSRPRRVVVRQHAQVTVVAHVGGRARTLPARWGWRVLELVRDERGWRLRSARSGTPPVPP